MGAQSWCDESYQTPDGGCLPSSVTTAETLSIYSTKLICLWHLVAPDQLCLPSSNFTSAEMCKLLNGNIFCNYFLYYLFPLPRIYIWGNQQHLKIWNISTSSISETSSVPYHRSRLCRFFFQQHQTPVPILKNEHLKRVWTRIWTFIIILVSHIKITGSLWRHKLI